MSGLSLQSPTTPRVKDEYGAGGKSCVDVSERRMPVTLNMNSGASGGIATEGSGGGMMSPGSSMPGPSTAVPLHSPTVQHHPPQPPGPGFPPARSMSSGGGIVQGQPEGAGLGRPPPLSAGVGPVPGRNGSSCYFPEPSGMLNKVKSVVWSRRTHYSLLWSGLVCSYTALLPWFVGRSQYNHVFNNIGISPGNHATAVSVGPDSATTNSNADSYSSQWSNAPTSTLQYTQSMAQPPVPDVRSHPGYRKSFIVLHCILYPARSDC